MNKEEEIDDSLRFCKEMQLYYKSGMFENPKNIFEWEKYIPLAREEVQKKYEEETVYHNKELEEAVRYTNHLTDIEAASFEGAGQAELSQAWKQRKKEEEEEEDEEDDEEEESSFLRIIILRFVEAVLCIVLAFIISAGFNKYIGTHTMVEGSSMESSLHNGDYLLVDKLSYHLGKPKRFDIIIFPYNEETYYIKRIIGMPGETIRIAEGEIYINGEELEESFGMEPMLDSGVAAEEFSIGADEYFVLGDNRNHSTDSRSQNVGTIKEDDIIGKAFFRFYPLNNIGFIE